MRVKINLTKIKKRSFVFVRWLGENAFLGFLFLFLVALLLSAGVFYKYVVTVQDVEIDIGIGGTNFHANTFQQVLEEWDSRAKRFEQATGEKHTNIFLPPVVQEELEEESEEEPLTP